jgi:hypothetical protein
MSQTQPWQSWLDLSLLAPLSDSLSGVFGTEDITWWQWSQVRSGTHSGYSCVFVCAPVLFQQYNWIDFFDSMLRICTGAHQRSGLQCNGFVSAFVAVWIYRRCKLNSANIRYYSMLMGSRFSWCLSLWLLTSRLESFSLSSLVFWLRYSWYDSNVLYLFGGLADFQTLGYIGSRVQ